jgi:hypothetical protein
MAEHTCHNCVYSHCDAALWLRRVWAGEPVLLSCANHPRWPGRMREVAGVPCRNYRPKPALPGGDDVRLIPLTDGCYAYVDAADYEWLSRWNWYVCSAGYASRREDGETIFMHREIMRPPKGMVVDHKDGNKSNNCRSNLRVCTRGDNQRNQRKQSRGTSRFKGVCCDKRDRKWRAQYGYRGQHYTIGRFDTELEAARAYDRMAVELFGDFARLNFPEEWPPHRRQELQGTRKREGGKVATKQGKNPTRRRQPKVALAKAPRHTMEPP